MRNIALELPLYFYLLMEKSLACGWKVWSPVVLGGTYQLENNHYYISKVTVRLQETK